MDDLVSIIVPIYNVEEYLPYCIESLIMQSYSNLEIVLIDDGSTDCSGILCDKYQAMDNRIVVIHKKNGGVSESRNIGIDKCKGRYITFVDGDDCVDKDYVSSLVTSLKKYSANISICAWKHVTTLNDCNVDNKENAIEEVLLDARGALRYMLLQKIYTGGVCCCLYKRELWENVRFPIGKRHAEDVFVNALILSDVDKCVLSSKKLYNYCYRDNSTQNEPYTKDKLEEFELISKAKDIIDSKFPELSEATDNRLVSSCFHILLFMNKKELNSYTGRQLKKVISNKRLKLICGKDVNKKVRMACLISCGGFRLLKILYELLNMRGKINL